MIPVIHILNFIMCSEMSVYTYILHLVIPNGIYCTVWRTEIVTEIHYSITFLKATFFPELFGSSLTNL